MTTSNSKYPSNTYYLDSTLFFGKYKGKTVQQVKKENPGYIRWLQENTQHKIILTLNPNPLPKVDDEDWKLVDPRTMRIWSQGYRIMQRPTPINQIIDFS